MKKLITTAVLATALVVDLAAVASARPEREPVVGREPAMITSFGPIVSHHGTVRGTVVSHTTTEGRASWVVELRTTDHLPIDRAHVGVVAYMPEDSTVAAREGIARYVGKGRYEIAGLNIDRAGWWNVGLSVTRRGASDSLAFNLLLPGGRTILR